MVGNCNYLKKNEKNDDLFMHSNNHNTFKNKLKKHKISK